MSTPDYSHMSTPPPVEPSATVHTLADVPAERVAWLWHGRLPLGKLVVVDGDPSTGEEHAHPRPGRAGLHRHSVARRRTR